ncbi:SDR family NAD(P)-dependent oxidoreductase [Pseudopedobacter beijingensis]|uniref:SDR family NAD(P)-dependent oxidoreductase n=1 Tax=Pseudopedobacter beijingensis TaxID=1207056 RepID=A0ABW4IA84_9SPHI
MISILGCGWLGFPLAKSFITNGISVKGSTTQQQKTQVLSENKIEPYLIELSDNQHSSIIYEFLKNETLIINIPPGRYLSANDKYLENLTTLNKYILNSNLKNVIFISSTSVYKNASAEITEEGDIDAENKLFFAEQIFRENKKINTTIIRMGGLFGPLRHPGRFFSGKPSVANGLVPVNMIHLDDCITIIQKVIAQHYWNQTINACSPHHPTRKKFYTEAIKLYGGTIPDFVEENGQKKIISPQKLIKDLDYQFIHPDLIKSLNTLV